MSRTPGKSVDDLEAELPTAQEAAAESSQPARRITTRTVLAAEARPDRYLGEDPSLGADLELLARDELAAAALGDRRRADGLLCARALLAERQAHQKGDSNEESTLSLWRSAFDHDPTLLIAFWGLRRALQRRGAWDELRGVLEARIAAIAAVDAGPGQGRAEGHGQKEVCADLWLDHGRIAEDRLHRDDEAGRSYRAGLTALPGHPGLLTSLLLLGFRRSDLGDIGEALAGFLDRSLPPAARASMAAALARITRLAGERRPASGPLITEPLEQTAALRRALAVLHTALGVVGPEAAEPLTSELSRLARATADPALRATILGELIAHLPRHAGGGAGDRKGMAGLAAALLRERARLLRDHLNDPAGAAAALRAALIQVPGHPAALTELGELIETISGPDVAQALEGLGELLERTAPGRRPLQNDAERELALRYLTALAVNGRAPEGLALLDRHPELDRERPDVFALEMLLRTATADLVGLSRVFERAAEIMLVGPEGQSPSRREAAAHGLVVAGTLLERDGTPRGPGPGDDLVSRTTRLYRRAVEIGAGYPPARDALERRLGAGGRWRELVESLEQSREELVQLERAGTADPAGSGWRAENRVEISRVLEDLVAAYRDGLDDPVAARGHQEELIARDPDQGDVRMWTRLQDLEIACAIRGRPSPPAAQARILSALAERVGVPALGAALRVEAARILAGPGGSPASATALLERALPDDTTGAASSGLERLTVSGSSVAAGTGSLARAALVREELSRVTGTDLPLDEKADRLRALAFRLAWHALGGGRIEEALVALHRLGMGGDQVAQAWSWEIARGAEDPRLALGLLQPAPPAISSGALILPTDLGETLARAGNLPAAAAAFREAQRSEPSVDAALGLLRMGSALGNAAVVLEATRALAGQADEATARSLRQEAAMLALFQGEPGSGTRLERVSDDDQDPLNVTLRWATGARDGDILGAATGLLAIARSLSAPGAGDPVSDRNGILARAAARARLGGVALSGPVHDQVAALSTDPSSIATGLADLPVAGRAERISARIARAAKVGGQLAYALDLECGLDAESRGDAPAALEAFGSALGREPEGIEALDGIKRVALSTGDRLGAARTGVRLGAVLKSPAHAAAELGMAGQLFEEIGLLGEASVAFWQALARDPASKWLYEKLRLLISARADWPGLDRLYGHRLTVLGNPEARTALLHERALHRLKHLEDREAAVLDFKRILKIDPDHLAALRELATLARQMEQYAPAIHFLERLLARSADHPQQAVAVSLELADAHESARDPARAVEILHRATVAQPGELAPWQRLTDLLLRLGDWSGALTALRRWVAVLTTPAAQAGIWIRIGCLLRDHGRDQTAAAEAFARASHLDPLGDGIPELMASSEQPEGALARQRVLREAIAELRQRLATDPLHIPHLRRLKELYEWATPSDRDLDAGASRDAVPPDREIPPEAELPIDGRAGALIAGQLLSLAGEDVDVYPAPRLQLRGELSADFWNRIQVPGSRAFAAEIWSEISAAAAELLPEAPPEAIHRERVSARLEPRLAWVEAAGAAAGLPTLEIWMAQKGRTSDKWQGQGRGQPRGQEIPDEIDEAVTVLAGHQPALLMGRAILTGNATARFRVGRALVLLREDAVALERISVIELEDLFADAAVVAGVPVSSARLSESSAAPGGSRRGRSRALAKAMSRKARKALERQAPRFTVEPIDAAGFRAAVLATADRFGLIMAGDIGTAVQVVTRRARSSDDAALTSADVAGEERAMALIRFALSDDYLTLRGPSQAWEV